MVRLTEISTTAASYQVDEENGIIRGVKLIGPKSRNGREYAESALDNAVELYEGAKIYANHPRRQDVGEDRPLDDWVGVVRRPRRLPDGIYGDVELRKESKHFRGIVEMAKRFPNHVGFSHVADGESEMRGNTEFVTRIREVLSVDLVTEPATTRGIFESANYGQLTLRDFVERLPAANPFRAKLVEAINTGLVSGGTSLFDPGDKAGAVDPLKLLYQALEKALDVLAAVVDGKSASAPVGGESHNPGATPFKSTDGNAVAESDGRYRERFEVRTGIARDTYETEFARAAKRAGQAVRR
ncbi:MAG: hypothetical protein U0805_01920 [Pirellulales bacterium]